MAGAQNHAPSGGYHLSVTGSNGSSPAQGAGGGHPVCGRQRFGIGQAAGAAFLLLAIVATRSSWLAPRRGGQRTDRPESIKSCLVWQSR